MSWRPRTGSPERVVGLHFFNPVSRMKLIEVVVGRQTSDETRDRALAFARQIGKLPVLVQRFPGFPGQPRSLSRICSMPPRFFKAASAPRRSTGRWCNGACRWGRCV